MWALLAVFLLIASAPAATGDIRVEGRRPELVFASDSDTAKLQTMFSDPALVAQLARLHAGIALSLEDLSPERAAIVRRLNNAGVPVIAWMALPRDQGYYLNADNALAAEKRFGDFEKWTTTNGLHWEAIGLDIEPSLGDWSEIQKGHGVRLLWTLLKHAFDWQRIVRARTSYNNLIREMQAHGYMVQTYQLQFLADERRVHSTAVERLFGIVDVRGNDEVFMIYSSFNHALNGGLVWAYGPDAQSIAVGSTATSGDPNMDAKYRPLDWEEFSRDLVVASHFSHEVGVYSLEGCVVQGFLPKLEKFDWQQTVVLSASSVEKARKLRRGVQTILWMASHVVYIGALALLLLLWLAVWWRRRRRRRRQTPSLKRGNDAPSA